LAVADWDVWGEVRCPRHDLADHPRARRGGGVVAIRERSDVNNRWASSSTRTAKRVEVVVGAVMARDYAVVERNRISIRPHVLSGAMPGDFDGEVRRIERVDKLVIYAQAIKSLGRSECGEHSSISELRSTRE